MVAKSIATLGGGCVRGQLKMSRWTMLVPLLALLLAVQSGEAKIGDTSGRNTLKAAAATDVEVEYEGSGDNEDDEDYLDDDDYDDEGSGYVYDDEEADLIPDEEKPSRKTEYPPFGSSEEELGKKENAVDDDFHFDESGKNSANDEEGELYEYYSEDYEPEYDDDDDEYDEEYEDERSSNNRVLYRAESDIVVTAASDESDSGSLDLSYLYIVLASAFVSFALALATFFLCRSRSLAERQRVRMKQQSAMAMGAGSPSPSSRRPPPPSSDRAPSSRAIRDGGSLIAAFKVPECT